MIYYDMDAKIYWKNARFLGIYIRQDGTKSKQHQEHEKHSQGVKSKLSLSWVDQISSIKETEDDDSTIDMMDNKTKCKWYRTKTISNPERVEQFRKNERERHKAYRAKKAAQLTEAQLRSFTWLYMYILYQCIRLLYSVY